jgi:hypothetical protein
MRKVIIFKDKIVIIYKSAQGVYHKSFWYDEIHTTNKSFKPNEGAFKDRMKKLNKAIKEVI